MPRSRYAPALDEADDPDGRLLDRELRDVDHGTAKLAVDCRRLLELLVDLDQPCVLLARGLHQTRTLASDVREA